MKNIAQALGLAFKNIKSRLFHTFLSVLGIIIGVGALVSMLSLIDGLEKFAKDQIEQTTSLNTVMMNTSMFEEVNGVRVPKDSIRVFDFEDVDAMMQDMDNVDRYTFAMGWPNTVQYGDSTFGAQVSAMARFETNEESIANRKEKLVAGANVNLTNSKEKQRVATVNESLANLLKDSTAQMESLLNQELKMDGNTLTIIGVTKNEDGGNPSLEIPAGLFDASEIVEKSPMVFVQSTDIAKLKDLQGNIQEWIKKNRPQLVEDIKVEVNEFRMEQLEQGFMFFKIIMGLLVGISVVVGGVGIMNVMLITVKERTPEIGIRKAIGAKRRDILSQFLTESVVVSVLGSLLGVIFGWLFTKTAIPIVNHFVKQKNPDEEMLLQAVFTAETMIVIAIIAVLIGIIFGTYPAIRASRLNPVDAINRV